MDNNAKYFSYLRTQKTGFSAPVQSIFSKVKVYLKKKKKETTLYSDFSLKLPHH